MSRVRTEICTMWLRRAPFVYDAGTTSYVRIRRWHDQLSLYTTMVRQSYDVMKVWPRESHDKSRIATICYKQPTVIYDIATSLYVFVRFANIFVRLVCVFCAFCKDPYINRWVFQNLYQSTCDTKAVTAQKIFLVLLLALRMADEDLTYACYRLTGLQETAPFIYNNLYR